MPLTRDTLTDVAAIAASQPQLVLRLSTLHGGVVTVGEHPAGAMCADGFRRLMAAWVDGCEPHVDGVEFVGASFDLGLLETPGGRSFATRLSAEDVAACLRSREDWPAEVHAVVRQDLMLGVSVVHVTSDSVEGEALDEVARDAQAACAVEELCREVSAA